MCTIGMDIGMLSGRAVLVDTNLSGLPEINLLLCQIYTDVTGRTFKLAGSA